MSHYSNKENNQSSEMQNQSPEPQDDSIVSNAGEVMQTVTKKIEEMIDSISKLPSEIVAKMEFPKNDDDSDLSI